MTGMMSAGGGGNSEADRLIRFIDIVSDPARSKGEIVALVEQLEGYKAQIEAAKREAARIKADATAEANSVVSGALKKAGESQALVSAEKKRLKAWEEGIRAELGADRAKIVDTERRLAAQSDRLAEREAAADARGKVLAGLEADLKRQAEELAKKRRYAEEMARMLG